LPSVTILPGSPLRYKLEMNWLHVSQLSAAERKWGKAGGLKFRFLPCPFLPPLPAKALLPSCAWVFFAVFFFVFFAGRFFAGWAPDEALAEPT
jgi:hypothetical protein